MTQDELDAWQVLTVAELMDLPGVRDAVLIINNQVETINPSSLILALGLYLGSILGAIEDAASTQAGDDWAVRAHFATQASRRESKTFQTSFKDQIDKLALAMTQPPSKTKH